MQFMVSNQEDAIWYNHSTNQELDIDELFEIDMVKDIVLDPEEKIFYFLANKRLGELGFYLIKFDAKNPKDFKFLTSWKHKLEIGDANVFILQG